MNLRTRLEGLERKLKRRPPAISVKEMTDEQLIAIVAEGNGFTPQQWAALSEADQDTVIDQTAGVASIPGAQGKL
jgi:hypothetical protein